MDIQKADSLAREILSGIKPLISVSEYNPITDPSFNVATIDEYAALTGMYNLIRSRDKAIIEKARQEIARKGKVINGWPYVELGWIDDSLDSILRDLS
jgi:hypothetical protein